MRTLTLELLRHGPPHNQLLSPLTPYLALCENHAPVTLYVPFEQNQFLHRLSALTYELDDKHRKFQLQDTGRELGKVLSAIPGLMAELGNDAGPAPRGVTHLRLVLSASELALLPFELAICGNGFPGAGQPLLLQSEAPICITREVRRVDRERLRWTDDVRILFASAAPAGLPPVPLESHLLALRQAIDPWVGYFDAGNDADRRKEVGRHLTVLPRASVRGIQEECAIGRYTHVHILAHGVAHQVGFDTRFGLALHQEDPEAEADIVTGERLATALRATQRPDRAALVRPMAVTLASCNSGNVGSVVGVGASVAHALQEAGIPLVVAGQFPLTSGGSVQLVEQLYNGLLWGVDPREMLMDLRRRLHSEYPHNHDWAALTAYASLPADFDAQVATVRVRRARRAIDKAMEYADAATRRVMPRRTKEQTRDPSAQMSSNEAILAAADAKVAVAKQRMRIIVNSAVAAHRSEALGLLASAEKRHAEVNFWFGETKIDEEEKRRYTRAYPELLRKAQLGYWECFMLTPSASWAVVQYVALTRLLQVFEDPDAVTYDPRPGLDDLWTVARTLSVNDLDAVAERRGWALGNLIELCLLAQVPGIRAAEQSAAGQAAGPQQPGVPLTPEPQTAATLVAEAKRHVRDLLGLTGGDPFQLYSTRRQLLRFETWYPRIGLPSADLVTKSPFAVAGGFATELLKMFPPEEQMLERRLL